jgi:hypothetical protein
MRNQRQRSRRSDRPAQARLIGDAYSFDWFVSLW